jgi:hypothetical protein
MPDAVGLKFFSLVHDSDQTDYSAQYKKRHDLAQTDAPQGAGQEVQPPLAASRLAGVYHAPALGEIRIASDDDGLAIKFLKPDLTGRLVHRDGALFLVRITTGWLADIGWGEAGDLRFTQSEEGQIDGFDIHLGEAGQGATFRVDRVLED